MKMNTNQIISITEANQNFSIVSKKIDQMGKAIIFKNNKPKYLIVDISDNDYIELSDEEKIEVISKRILKKYHKAFEELAKW